VVKSNHGLIKVLCQNLPGGTEKCHKNLSQNIRCRDRDATEHLRNTSLDRYLCCCYYYYYYYYYYYCCCSCCCCCCHELCVSIDGVSMGEWIYGPLTCISTTRNYKQITAPSLISTIHKSPQHLLSLFQPAISSPAVTWQRLLTP
jgi:hypothetical protein